MVRFEIVLFTFSLKLNFPEPVNFNQLRQNNRIQQDPPDCQSLLDFNKKKFNKKLLKIYRYW